MDILNESKEKHSKMDNMEYYELKMQDYLQDENISVKQARILFKYRTRMARFWENYKAGRPPQPCPVCKDVQSVDTQRHSFKCKTLTGNIEVNGNYEDIFSSQIADQTLKSVEKIEKFREIYKEQ